MKQPDFIQIPFQVLTDVNLQPLDLKVYGYIYWMCSLKMEKCIASNDTLAELSMCKPTSITASLKRLEDNKHIIRVMNGNNRSEIVPVHTFKQISRQLKQVDASIQMSGRVNSNELQKNIIEEDNVRYEESLEEIKRNKIKQLTKDKRIITADTHTPDYKKPIKKKVSNNNKWMVDLINWYCKEYNLEIPAYMEKQFKPLKEIRKLLEKQNIYDETLLVNKIKEKMIIYYPTCKWMDREPDFFNLASEWHKIKDKKKEEKSEYEHLDPDKMIQDALK